jgi:hypothetical protein
MLIVVRTMPSICAAGQFPARGHKVRASNPNRLSAEVRAMPNRIGPRPYRGAVKNSTFEPGDEQRGQWDRETLERMDARFTEKIERAFSLGLESRASAAAQVELPTTGVPRFSAPLCPEVWAALWRSNAPAPIAE